MESKKENNDRLRPYTMKELCRLYGVSAPTLRKWLKPFQKAIGVRIGHYYTIAQVKIIFEKLEEPGSINDDELKSEKIRND